MGSLTLWSSALETLTTASQGTIAGIVVATGLVAATTFLLTFGQAEVRGKNATALGGGSLKKEQVKSNWTQYDKYFKQSDGQGVEEKSKAPQFVDTFYNLVTDIYEWGWGQSFHFSPAIKGKSDKESTIAHENMVADLLQLKPGMVALDAGCGVGGPMRAIAKHSQAQVVGITINEYQVQRANSHNKRAKLDHLCRVVQGNFLEMPFADSSFDAAYSIEATCHAPVLREVYKEVFRVLKPGSLYVTYEWVTTPLYDGKNPEHVRIIDSINHGNALPEMRSYKDIVSEAKAAGFEIVENRDLALPPALSWWKRLKMGRLAYYRNGAIVGTLSALNIAPKGLPEVHEMLYNVSISLCEGGETGVFTPMHLLLLRKPA